MILASLNCNKRLGNPAALKLLEKWLMLNKIDLLLVQEPWSHNRASPVDILFYRPLGGNSRVFAWVKEGCTLNMSRLVTPYWQQLEVDYLIIHNVYLDAYQKTVRGEQLNLINEGLAIFNDRPHIIVGDFNLAPDPEDGLSGTFPSDFNGPEDREPFKKLLSSHNLVDATSRQILGKQEFTIIRNIGRVQSHFRCDLCLISDYLFITKAISLKYDHAVRDSSTGFTDHSALILDIPVTVAYNKRAFQKTLFPLDDSSEVVSEFEYCPHKTAIARGSPSPIAKLIVEGGLAKQLGGIKTILDYGCGRGRDVEYYRSMHFNAEGYDPYPPFGFDKPPSHLFDLACVVFVLNVLPNCWQRLQVVKKVAEYLRLGGYIMLATRSPQVIESEAQTKKWKRHNDGYWSHEGKGTFQRGISTEEMIALIKRVGLTPHPLTKEISLGQTINHLLAQKV